MSEDENKVPQVIVSTDEYNNINEKLNKVEEKVEFTIGEYYQRLGHQTGRDVGILYGIIIGLVILIVIVLKFGFIQFLLSGLF
jgi:tetrahydromethanopterin S-methyltransferase subunit G